MEALIEMVLCGNGWINHVDGKHVDWCYRMDAECPYNSVEDAVNNCCFGYQTHESELGDACDYVKGNCRKCPYNAMCNDLNACHVFASLDNCPNCYDSYCPESNFKLSLLFLTILNVIKYDRSKVKISTKRSNHLMYPFESWIIILDGNFVNPIDYIHSIILGML